MTFAVILAAGRSRRTGKINKIFYQIKGKPLIFYTISIFENHPQINKIILVSRKSDFKKFSSLIKDCKFKKIKAVVEEGKERQGSAFNGLRMVEILKAKPGDLILFHNGVNPMISKTEISKVLEAAKEYGAALVGQPAKDTLKKVDKNNFVLKTVDRKNIYLAQTPQVIEYELAKKAFEEASRDGFLGTDDVSLIERLGMKIKMVPCSYKNIKVTARDDLKIIKCFLEKNK